MEPVWLKNYEPGVPKTINPDAYPSLNALFTEILTKYADLPAFTNMGQILTYAEVDQRSKNFAAFLQQKLGLTKGERFAIMLPNMLHYPIAMLGILRAGCVVVNVNPMYTVEEFERQMHDAQASGVIVLENFVHIVQQALPKTELKHVVIAKIGDFFPVVKACLVDLYVRYIRRMIPQWHLDKVYYYQDIEADGAKLKYTELAMTGSDLAFLQYTGGTTGVPKGAMLTHRNMLANVLQDSAWLVDLLTPRKEIIITALPLYHIFSLTANCLTFMYYGALNVLITNPRDVKAFIADLKRFKFTAITGVNTLFNLLLNVPSFASVDFSALKVALGGGMAVQKIVATRWQELTKKPLLPAYGLTEASPGVCINPMNLKAFNDTIGLPIPSTEISVRDEAGHELGFNQAGELWVRGPQVMLGYWRQEEETRKVLTDDGWLKTGDIVVVDEQGFVKVIDRIKDMIVISGFKVYPNEVEDVIAAMPGVKEVAVIGVPDPNTGEQVKALIVKNNSKITVEDVRAYCHQHLTGYKVPRMVEFRDNLPKSPVGKILHRELRQKN